MLPPMWEQRAEVRAGQPAAADLPLARLVEKALAAARLVADDVDRLLDSETARLVEKALAAARLVADDVDRLLDSETDRSGLGEMTQDALLAFVESVVGAVTAAAEEPPAIGVEVERHVACWAAEGYSLEALVRLYGFAHQFAMHRAVATVETDPRDPARTQQLLARAVELGPRIHAGVIGDVVARFGEVQARDRRVAGNWKLRLARHILTGDPVDESTLGYPVATTVEDAWRGRTLRVCADAQTLWLWLAADSPDRSALPRLAFGLPPGTLLGLGDPGEGRVGFIESHRQALVALRLAPSAGRAIAYEQVALVALLAQDPSRAREFMARELGQLNAEGNEAERLRATVRAYLDCQLNVASTAALIHVHENTVKHRLGQIRMRLGRSVRARATELDVALRLRELDAGAWVAIGQARVGPDPSV